MVLDDDDAEITGHDETAWRRGGATPCGSVKAACVCAVARGGSVWRAVARPDFTCGGQAVGKAYSLHTY